MAWTSLGAIRSSWQNDISTLVRGYYDNVNPTARTVDMTVDVYMSTTNGRFLSANVSGNGYIAGDGPTDTRDFTAGSNADTGFTYYTRSISYNANGEAVVTWGGWLRANNVLAFDQSIYTPSGLPSIPPLALTGLTVTRVSDTQHTVAWSIPAGVTNTEVVVQRRTDDGAWTQVGRPAGNVSSWIDTTTVANRKYEYRVAGVRSGRQAAWTGTVVVYTTPAPPAAVSAEKVGSNIAVTASGLPTWATAYDVQESTDGGTTWSTLQTGVTSWPWTHISPSNAVTHTYRVRSTRGALASAYSAQSNTVALLAAPNAPTGLNPNGIAVSADATQRFSWVHNPVDTTSQTAYELRHRLVGAPTWTTVSGTTADYRDFSFAAGEREWQVRTKGQHASWSPWSSVATASIINAPGVAVTQPGGTWDQPILPVTWSWFQLQGRPQSAWEAELLDDVGQRIEFRQGSGPATATTFDARLTTGNDYTVRVRAATGGLWSPWGVQAFSTLFVPPALAVVESAWNDSTGSMGVTIAEGSGDVAVVSFDVDRSINGGTTWEPVLRGATLDGADNLGFEDFRSLSRGVTLYRVTAWALSGASSAAIHEAVGTSRAVWLSGGDDLTRTARLPYDPVVKISAGRARSVQRYEGRSHGVPYAGEQLSRLVEASGRLRSGDPDVVSVEALVLVAQDAAPLHMYRDPDGRRIDGVLSSVTMPRQSNIGLWGYGFTLEESDR